MIFSKKAVSPLIATVLLISFAVALGAVVMAFGSRTFEENVGNSCMNVNIDIPSVCYEPSKKMIMVSIDNKGSSNLESTKIWVIGDGIQKIDILDPILAGSLITKEVPYDHQTYGEIKGINLIPAIAKKDQTLWCVDNTISRSDIGFC